MAQVCKVQDDLMVLQASLVVLTQNIVDHGNVASASKTLYSEFYQP